MKRFILALFLICSVFSLSGCELYEEFVSCVKRVFSTDEYDVSVIGCATVLSNGQVAQRDESFTRYITAGMRDGVWQLSQRKGMRHIRLVNSVPKQEHSSINRVFFSKNNDLEDVLTHLRSVSQRYSTNILVLGATVEGETRDTGHFAGWLYRRDLDSISGTPTKITFTPNMGRRERESDVSKAVAELIENSVGSSDPIPMLGLLDADLAKTGILTVLESLAIQAMASE